jgi:HSP20 family molecular chaperone IbpA
MASNTKSSLLIGALFLSLGTVGALGYYSWSLNKKVNSFENQTTAYAFTPVQQSATPSKSANMVQKHWNPWSDNWDPTGQFAAIQKQMSSVMRQLMPKNPIFTQQGFGFSNSPQITMTETPKKYSVIIKVPKGENVNVSTSLDHNVLNISGKVKDESQKNLKNGQEQMESISHFSQTIGLAGPIVKSDMSIQQKGKDILITIPRKTS